MHRVLLLVVMLGCGKAADPTPSACDGPAIASSAAKEFLELATVARQSSARSGPDVAIAMCQAANTAIWQVRQLLQAARREDLTRISYRLSEVNCAAGYLDASSPDEAKRQAAATAWTGRESAARDVLNLAMNDCYGATGESPRSFPTPPPIVLPTE